MSAVGGTGGTSIAYVWIKLDKDVVFAHLRIKRAVFVGEVTTLACSTFPRWRLDAGQVRLHPVTVSGMEPSEEEISAARATKPLAVSAAVTSGAWLVAVPSKPSGVSGGGGVEVARSSISPRSLKSLELAHGRSREAEASVEFWKLAHAAFPCAALQSSEQKLLGGERLISSREFKAADFLGSFETGRTAFTAATLSKDFSAGEKGKLEAPGRGISQIDFSDKGDYTKRAYEMVEVDCLLKLPALAPSDWMRDPDDTNPPFFIAPPNLQQLPVRPNPNVQVPASPFGLATNTRFSFENYPANPVMYLVGEVYAPLSSEDPMPRTVQKLLQAERTLQFLSAKEGKAVGDCVLGVVFLGPHMNVSVTSQLYRSLNYYKELLPCVWTLHTMKRLLGYSLEIFRSAVQAHLTDSNMTQLNQRMEMLEQKDGEKEERPWCSLM